MREKVEKEMKKKAENEIREKVEMREKLEKEVREKLGIREKFEKEMREKLEKELKDKNKELKNLTNIQVTNNCGKIIIKN